MASIDVTEIFEILYQRGQEDASPFKGNGFFLEITFDKFRHQFTPSDECIDNELADKVITADTQYGLATIIFDRFGQLSKIEIC